MGLEIKPNASLQIRENIEQEFPLQLKENLEDMPDVEDISEEEAVELGLYERSDATRIAAGPGWELIIEPLNYILREGQRYSYHDRFDWLLDTLWERKVKFYLSQEKWLKVQTAIELAQQDMHNTLYDIKKVLKFLGKKYSVIDSSL